jgi:hypothetical protein
MPQFALLCPLEDELADAQEALGHILDLDDVGEIDLPPYLTRLLLQLQDILLATTPHRGGVAVPARRSPQVMSR